MWRVCLQMFSSSHRWGVGGEKLVLGPWYVKYSNLHLNWLLVRGPPTPNDGWVGACKKACSDTNQNELLASECGGWCVNLETLEWYILTDYPGWLQKCSFCFFLIPFVFLLDKQSCQGLVKVKKEQWGSISPCLVFANTQKASLDPN